MVEGAVPLTTLRVSQAESLLAVQLTTPSPALPMLRVAVCGVVAPAGKVQPS